MNRLARETSPYLLQHAGNPVDWYPWGEEAFARARAENKPVFLSIGYSACHWCHVMERESFESDEVAALLNRYFVSVKVDREERPDLDEIYMTAVQMLTGSGGWPMTVFLTPDKKPFFGGTYFPPENKYGRVGFKTLLQRVAELWSGKREDIFKSADEITRTIGGHAGARPEAKGPLRPEWIERAVSQLEQVFDPHWGGFSEAPKFPPSTAIQLLMRRFARTAEEAPRTMVEHTLDHMARGGMYDQVGGGFHRYSVDERWLVPHFEKMLYDNAQLAAVYTEAWQLTHDPFYSGIAIETLDYVLRDMTHEHGAFFSSEDADSEGVEGKFYVWSLDELQRVLGKDDGALAAEFWGVSREGNFEGANILHVPVAQREFVEAKGLDADEFGGQVKRWKSLLLQARAERVRPGRDDKAVAAWNGLMISAFAKGGRVLGHTLYLEAARRAAQFVLSEMVSEGVLHRTWREGRAAHPAYLDDHAFLIQGLLDLYEAEGDAQWLDAASEWMERTVAEFGASDGGSFFYTSERLHRDVLVRSRPAFDGAEPSANAVTAHVLLRLGALTGQASRHQEGEALLEAHAGHMERMPRGMLTMLAALDFYLGPVRELVIAGEPGQSNWDELRRVMAEIHLPNAVTAYAFPGQADSSNALLTGKGPVNGRAAVYVCENQTCQAPVTTADELRKALA